MKRNLLIVCNPSRKDAVAAAVQLEASLSKTFDVFTISDIDISGIKKLKISDLPEIEVGIVLGGDGTTLRAAEVAHLRQVPLLGVNLGHVGFLSEVEESNIADVISAVLEKSYVIDPRITLKYEVSRNGQIVDSGWALNEVTVEREKTTMVELFLEIDNRPISRWGCDGLICSTPTGSTAYAFSAGGPILWPEVDALVVLPISAHALFSRPLVISPTSKIVVGIESAQALLSADALRKFPLIAKDKVFVTKNDGIIKLAHLKNTSFSDRLVAKFKLPVEGWRGE
ncbi:MAG: NAD kinase [Streptomycetaceae bacterium]|nr:NAD kinase [Streptomycetaceae bacterium]